MLKYVDYDMCKACGGVCCKQIGCMYLPRDFKRLDFNSLKTELNKGNISIAGQPIGGINQNGWTVMMHLRARNINADIVDLFTAGGPCKLLTPDGCSLPESKRPTVGLRLQPTKIGGPCENKVSTTKITEWFNYCEVLDELIEYYSGKPVMDVIIEEILTRKQVIQQKIDSKEELNPMEQKFSSWYNDIIANKPYYTPNEVKKLKLQFKKK